MCFNYVHFPLFFFQGSHRVIEDPNDLRHDIERRRKQRLHGEPNGTADTSYDNRLVLSAYKTRVHICYIILLISTCLLITLKCIHVVSCIQCRVICSVMPLHQLQIPNIKLWPLCLCYKLLTGSRYIVCQAAEDLNDLLSWNRRYCLC